MRSDNEQPGHGLNGQLGKVAGRSDKGKPIVHTIDPNFILGIARVSAFGARKYHMRNFLMAPGMKWSQVYDSLMRHLFAYWGGEELDVGPNGEFGETDDPATNMQWSGLPHIDMVAWNVMVLCTYRNHSVFHPGDDRPASLEYEGGIWQDWQEEFDTIRQIDAAPAPVAEEKPARALDRDYMGTNDDAFTTHAPASPTPRYLGQAKRVLDIAALNGHRVDVTTVGDTHTITVIAKDAK